MYLVKYFFNTIIYFEIIKMNTSNIFNRIGNQF